MVYELNNSTSQAATQEDEAEINHNNLPETLFHHLHGNIKPCEVYNLEKQTLDFDKRSYSIIHINISILQSYFDELKEFLSDFPNPPSIILLSETRINVDPHINVDIPDYIFVHVPSPTKAGGVGVYVSKHLNITIIYSLSLNVHGCEDLWFNVDFLGFKSKYTFAVMYGHPWNNHNVFLEALDVSMQKLNRHGDKALIFGDINIDLNSDKNLVPLTDYSHILQSNAFISLNNKPTRVTRTSQTVIDHILTNDCESILTPGVLTYNIADH